MIVFHALSNTFFTWLKSYLAEPQEVSIFMALMPWTIVGFMQKRIGKEQFPGMPRYQEHRLDEP